MRSARNKASCTYLPFHSLFTGTQTSYIDLPSNVQYLAETNGLEGGAHEALQKLISSEWITVGAGFYFDCPFLVSVSVVALSSD